MPLCMSACVKIGLYIGRIYEAFKGKYVRSFFTSPCSSHKATCAVFLHRLLFY